MADYGHLCASNIPVEETLFGDLPEKIKTHTEALKITTSFNNRKQKRNRFPFLGQSYPSQQRVGGYQQNHQQNYNYRQNQHKFSRFNHKNEQPNRNYKQTKRTMFTKNQRK